MKNMVWIDNKGRKVEISSMSDRWLNNIRKKFSGNDNRDIIKSVLDEIKRRKKKRKNG